MYDPSVGKWISADPIGFDGTDTNLSRYVGNSPTNATDPTGLDPLRAGSFRGAFRPGGAMKQYLDGGKHELKLRYQGLYRHDEVKWSDFKGSAGELFHYWWDERNIPLKRDVTIKGDTPFTLELRESKHFKNTIKTIQDDMRKYATASPRPNVIEGTCTRSFSHFNAPRGASDVYDMFIRLQAKGFNVADVFLGSFVGKYKVYDIDWVRKTAKVEFTVKNPTGWQSATKVPWGHVYKNSDGAYYFQTITWTQSLSW